MQNMPRSQDRSRAIARSEPITEVPEPDGFGLCELGEAYWRRIAPQLVHTNILTDLHIETFAALCRVYAEYVSLSNWLNQNPERCYFITESGYEVESPQMRQRDKALANLQKLWAKFGLTPEALARMRKHGGLELPTRSTLTSFAKQKYAAPNEKASARRTKKAR